MNSRPKLDGLFDLEAHRSLSALAPKRYVYMPWVAGHSDALLELVDPQGELCVPWRLFRSPELPAQRTRISAFVREHPQVYRQLVLRVLAPLRNELRGMIFTLDWPPALRVVVHVCRELDIPTLLVPHEAVFADRDRYYVDTLTGADAPICDRVLCWGPLQRGIFLERGYPEERISVVGSPKLDRAASFEPKLSKDLFARLYGLDPHRPIVLFAMQPLDSQYDTERARAAQNLAIADVFEACGTFDAQLIVRFPPSGQNLLDPGLLGQLVESTEVVFDDGAPYLSSAAEALHHADLTCSINSTMLLEGIIMGRQVLSLRYRDFGDLLIRAQVPTARTGRETRALFARALRDARDLVEGRAWIAQHLSTGVLPAESVARIRALLHEPQIANGVDFSAHLFADRVRERRYGTAAFHRTPEASMAHVESMLGFRHLLCAPDRMRAQSADVFVKWGIAKTEAKDRQDLLARELGRLQLIVEDGFLRSVDIGLSGSAGLSIIVDTKTAYYDATRPSRLEERLASNQELTHAQRVRAERCMMRLRDARLSKYNHAPDSQRRYGEQPRILIVDQRDGDMSVERGLANRESFFAMLEMAVAERTEHTLLVKRHPDATKGKKRSYFSNESLRDYLPSDRLILIDDEVNPYTLFDQVEEVFTVTSGVGMEALIAGLPVVTFGAPFYAGWGATTDFFGPFARRSRARTVTEIFHFAYIEASRYYAPHLGRAAEIEDVIDYLVQARERFLGVPPRWLWPRDADARVQPGQVSGQDGQREHESTQYRAQG